MEDFPASHMCLLEGMSNNDSNTVIQVQEECKYYITSPNNNLLIL